MHSTVLVPRLQETGRTRKLTFGIGRSEVKHMDAERKGSVWEE